MSDAQESIEELLGYHSSKQFPHYYVRHNKHVVSVAETLSDADCTNFLRNKRDQRKFVDMLFWKKKFQLHFPDRYRALLKLEKNSLYKNYSGINWLLLFRESYEQEYKTLPQQEKITLSQIKEGDVKNLKKGIRWRAADANKISLFQWLLYAIAIHDIAVIKTLVDKGLLNLHGRKNDCRVLLEYAVRFQRKDIIRYILSTVDSLEIRQLALTIAVEENSVDCVSEVLSFHHERKQQAPVRLEKKTFREHLTKLIHIKSKDVGFTLGFLAELFLLAAKLGHVDILEYLLTLDFFFPQIEKDFESRLFDEAKNTAIQHGQLKVVEFFLNRGMDPDEVIDHKFGISPLHVAAFYDQPKMIKFLIAHGAQVDLVDEKCDRSHRSPLHIAAGHGRIDSVNMLLKHKAQPSLPQSHDAAQPLHIAAFKNEVDIAETLIKSGVDVNASMKNGETPLFLAVHQGNIELVKLLLRHGADINCECRGKTLRDIAKNPKIKRILNIADYIRDRDADVRTHIGLFKCSFTLFGRTINVDKSAKVAAAKALFQFAIGKENKATLQPHQAALSGGRLRKLV